MSDNQSQNDAREKLDDKMREMALAEKEKQAARLATDHNLPYIAFKGFPVSPEAIAFLPQEQAQKLQAVCFFSSGNDFRIGAVNPALPELKEAMFQIEERTHGKGALYGISQASFEYAFALYDKLPKFRPATKGVAISQDDLKKFGEEFQSFSELQERLKGVSVTDMVTLLIAASMQSKSSDMHIEAEEAGIAVRFRIDGILHAVATLPKSDWPKIISRIKLLSGLKINIADKPQDGRFTISVSEGKVEVRVSTIPTAYGESVVMRLLRSTAVGLKFEDLGLRGRAYEQLKQEIGRPNGMIITTGPTGSGKTTTLYAILNTLNNPETKIITLEDPVEYKLAGVAQSQIDASKDYTFATGLRSILRQDPDVVMVGEIRDLETADIAIQAALTGHLVLSTIHTNSAAGAIPRFLAIGAKPFLLAPGLNAMIGQRLVRKIHEECKEEIVLDAATMKRAQDILGTLSTPDTRHLKPETSKFYHGRGCAKCFNLGYKGRIGIYEVMIMNKEIEEVILSGKVSEYVMQEIGIKNGMITMVQDGLLKALDGITTVEEVFSVAE